MDYEVVISQLSDAIFSWIQNDDDTMESKSQQLVQDMDKYIETYQSQDVVLDVEFIFRNVVILIQESVRSVSSDECFVSNSFQFQYIN